MLKSNNPFTGLGYLLAGFKLITQPGLRRYVAVPLAINILVFLGLGWLAFGWLDSWTEALIASLPAWLQWLDWISEILIFLALWLVAFFTFTLVANLISAPFNGPLAEAVEQRLRGSAVQRDEPWHAVFTELPTVFAEEFQKLYFSLTRSLPFLLLFIVPGINVIASLVWLLFSSWLLALQYVDYPWSNRKIPFKQQKEALKQNKLLATGFGGGVLFCTMIPVLNLLIIPVAVAGATKMVVEQSANEPVD